MDIDKLNFMIMIAVMTVIEAFSKIVKCDRITAFYFIFG
jgi:hypothetical protein